MSGKLRRLKAHWTALVLGAGVGGALGWFVAPQVFWALLLGGALTGGALWVAYMLIASSDHGGSR